MKTQAVSKSCVSSSCVQDSMILVVLTTGTFNPNQAAQPPVYRPKPTNGPISNFPASSHAKPSPPAWPWRMRWSVGACGVNRFRNAGFYFYWRKVNGRVRFSDGESVLSFHQTTAVSRFVKVQGDKSPGARPERGRRDGDWVYWSTWLGRDPSKPRRVTRLLKRQRGCCALCGLRFTTEDVIEVHHHDQNHSNNTFDNLRLMHGHCHDIVHGTRYL